MPGFKLEGVLLQAGVVARLGQQPHLWLGRFAAPTTGAQNYDCWPHAKPAATQPKKPDTLNCSTPLLTKAYTLRVNTHTHTLSLTHDRQRTTAAGPAHLVCVLVDLVGGPVDPLGGGLGDDVIATLKQQRDAVGKPLTEAGGGGRGGVNISIVSLLGG
jgi:hypothetical protein